MHFDNLITHIDKFVREHFISCDIDSRYDKLMEEVSELKEAIDSRDLIAMRKEACDCLIVTIHLLMCMGVKNILWDCFLKIEEVRNRDEYKKLRGEL